MSAHTRPLDPVASIKVKLGLLVAVSILAAVVIMEVGQGASVPGWLTVPVTLAVALGVTQWLARGMTSPLREMTLAASRMARGDHSARVTATSADEVGALARAFNTMAADLASADQQRRQLLATVSHELRTPLAAQQALLENLVDGVVTPDDASLQTVLAQSERLSALVSDLLDVSRVDGGATPLRFASVPVADLVAGAIEEAQVGSRDVRFASRIEPGDLVVTGDPDRLAQVLANLLDNASRHSPAGGLVEVTASALDAATWALEVTDEGPGIDPAHAEHVFRRFGVGDDSSGGTGLGLAIASWVCELHGGTIAALPPREGTSGARVRAVLPITPIKTTPAPHSHPNATASQDPEEPPMPTNMPDTIQDSPPPGAGTAPAQATPPSVIDTAFGRGWPDRGPRTAGFAVLASLAIGVVASLTLPYHRLGLGVVVVLLMAGALVLSQSVHRDRTWTLFSAALCVGLASLVVVRAAEWLAVLAVMTAGLLVTTALIDARRLTAVLFGPFLWILSGLRGLPLLSRTIAVGSQHRLAWPVLRTTALSLAALVVFGGLFASGDAVFGSWVSHLLPDVSIADSLVFRSFVWFFVTGVVLAACYLAINPPAVAATPGRPGTPVQRAWEWLTPVGVVIAVFAVFLAAQATAMWGGHDYVQRTAGISYADYVHQGFGQLTVATVLTLLTIAVAVRKAPRETASDRRTMQLVLGVLCVLTLVVVASALFRMAVYQQAYGFTVMRLLVDAFELWLGLLVVLVMVAGARMSAWWLPRAALASGAAMLLALGLANPEALVAKLNINRYNATGTLDLGTLGSLGPDAAPVIAKQLPNELSQCALWWQPGPADDSLWAWNLGRARAADIPVPAHTIGAPPQNCQNEIR
ncbi:MAG: DUF4173 domain-containing protein [Dermatophilus congolensis]|nr:DUF4173 domain-containing protein [Dermatophilus congolensis]